MNKKFTRAKAKKEAISMSASIDHLPFDGPSRQIYRIDSLGFPGLGHFLHKRHHFIDDEDEYHGRNQPPFNRKLENLLYSVSSKHKYYVYDIHYYETEKEKNPNLSRKTEDTLRIGVIAPMLLGCAQQNDEILEWAVKHELLPTDWDGPDVSSRDVSDNARIYAEIADTFVQCLLRTEAPNLVKISYHIGEWYSFSQKHAHHDMRRDYRLDRLKRDLQEIYLLQSIWYIYTDTPKEIVWRIAVFVCHQYFFYLADSEYRKHTLLRTIESSQSDTTAIRLKDEGNEHHKAERYQEAIDKYTEAIKISPYNHQLYSNRAISYLKLRENNYRNLPHLRVKCALSAMSDSFRSIKLNPMYVKGHDRYAMALFALNDREQAKKALEAAIKTMEANRVDSSEIKSLERRLAQYSAKDQTAKKKADSPIATTIAKSATKEAKASGDAQSKTKSKALDSSHENTSRASKGRTNSECSADSSDSSSMESKSSSSSGKAKAKTNDSACATTSSSKKDKDTATGKSKKSSKTDKAKSKKARKNSATTDSKEKELSPREKAPSCNSSGMAVKGDKAVEATAEELAAMELDRTIQSGSEALLQKKYRFAINLYDKCFSLMHESSIVKISLATDKMLLLRYARCVAYIYAGPNEDIILGIKELKHILELQPSQTMKAITLYEMGTAYTKQHRYDDATVPVKEALKLCDSKKGLRDAYSWPGTSVFIEHTDKAVLKARLTSLLNECINPPHPDFVCLSTLCSNYGHFNNAIYVDDPAFRGYVSILCTEKCRLHYHRDCWKKKHLKIDVGCVTPDCDGHILKCSEYDENLQKVHEEKSDTKCSKSQKEKKKVLKLKPSSLVRIEEVENKKKERKARRMERNKPATDVKEGADLADKILAAAENSESPAADLRNSNFVAKINKREDELEVERHSTRRANKKVKTKQVMTLDEFCGPPLFEDMASNNSSGSTPMPAQLREDVARFDQDYHMEKLPVVIQGVAVEKLKESVIEFYYEMLESGGPKKADSEELLGYLEFEKAAKELVEHCHGLAHFLKSSNRFRLIENFLCVNREEDVKKAYEMVEALRSAPYGVGVVQSDFKEKVEEAKDFRPERKLYSGYDDAPTSSRTRETYDTQDHWQSVVEDWNQSTRSDGASVGSRERSVSTSTEMSDGESDRQLIKVEPPTPALREEWKNYQDQKIMKSLDIHAEPDMAYLGTRTTEPNTYFSTPSAVETEEEVVDDILFSQNPAFNMLQPPAAHLRDQMAFPNSSASADSLNSEPNANTEIDLSLSLASNSNSKMFGGLYLTPPYHVPESLSPTSLPSSHAATVPYQAPILALPGSGPQRKTVAPIGTPYPFGSSALGLSSNHFSPAASWNSPSAPPSHNTVWPTDSGVSFGTQTDTPSSGDKACNTEYDIMDSYDKKAMECQGLQQRNENLADELTRLKQESSVNISDLKNRLKDAEEAEKTLRTKADKLQQQSEKESRKWKDDKKTLQEELSSVRQLSNEAKRRYESSESKLTEMKGKLETQKLAHDKEIEEKAAAIRKQQATLELLEQRLMDAQVEVVNERQRYALNQLEELLSTTNRSIEQQRLQVQRMVQGGGTLPNIVVKNAEFSNQRRERLMAVKREQESLYESQREAIRCGSIPLSNIPRLSPPSLMEIITSTSLPIPQPGRPMIPVGHQPGMVPMNPQLMQRMRSPLIHPSGAEKHVIGAQGDAEKMPGSPEANREAQALTDTPETAALKQQVNRKNAENQLIKDIQNVFPDLSSDDVRAYIAQLRETRQGLTGLKFAELKRHVIDLVLQSTSQRR